MTKRNRNYCKKKQPDVVRANLLEAAGQILAEEGPTGFTMDSIAHRAGVSKGGLVHHFASKQVLLEALTREMFEAFEKGIDELMASDPEPRGRFVRAYIRASFSPFESKKCVKLLNGLNVAMCHNEPLLRICGDWFKQQLEKHGIDALPPREQMLRFAADGIWAEESIGLETLSATEREVLVAYLVQQTYEL